MFCTKCGREIPEGGVCTCSAQQQQPIQQTQQVQQPVQQMQQPVQYDQSAASKLPDSQAIADGAKKAANAIKNNPIFGELLNTLKGVIVSPVKQVSANAARNDILWVFLAVIEALLIPFSLTTILRRGIFSVIGAAVHAMNVEIKYADYSKILSESGNSAVKIYFMNLLAVIICIFAAIGIVKLLMMICKKNASFFAVANMTTTVLLPFTMLMTLGGIFSMIYAPSGLVLAIAAIFTLAVLGYVGIQKLDKFTSSPFWQYIICIAVIFIIAAISGGVVLNGILSNIMNNIENIGSAITEMFSDKFLGSIGNYMGSLF